MRPTNAPREEDRPIRLWIYAGTLRVALQNGREIATPLDWYAFLTAATHEQREHVEPGASGIHWVDLDAGIHWVDLDADLSVAGMLQDIRPRPRRLPEYP